MFIAIPLEGRPTWHNPPWMTVLLILVNMLVFWGPQRSEEKAQERATHFYASSELPKLELPAFVKWLDDTHSDKAPQARRLLEHNAIGALLDGMRTETKFMAALRDHKIVTPSNPQFALWQDQRRAYDAMVPPPFTEHWAQDHRREAEWRPVTLLTSTFLHGSTAHLLGNMLFLFLFGFSVELALGRGLYLAFYLIGGIGASALASWAYAGTGGYGLGASGAVSALMAMYAMLYRLRRIRFFYQLLFYFNYVTAPALILLPAWIVNELLQHWLAGRGVAYMAHLGGLLTGAALMGARLAVRTIEPPASTAAPVDPDIAAFERHREKAQGHAAAMDFEKACAQWRAAAKLRPRDEATLRAYFQLAKLWPAGGDFHRAAHLIFRLEPQDLVTLELQHATYRSYLDIAKPGARLKPDDMARLARRFTRAKAFEDAQKLCDALVNTAPDHPGLGDTLSACVNGLWQAGQRDQAMRWLPQLEKLAPRDMVTQMLQNA